MTCPFLDYRSEDDAASFDHERAYCELAEAFVSPMRADVCNDRHEFDHEHHCEIFDER